jgi:hypothetical protein
MLPVCNYRLHYCKEEVPTSSRCLCHRNVIKPGLEQVPEAPRSLGLKSQCHSKLIKFDKKSLPTFFCDLERTRTLKLFCSGNFYLDRILTEGEGSVHLTSLY